MTANTSIKLRKLNLPAYKFRFSKEGESIKIYDSLRKKFLVLTPEEWVRQNFMRYVIEEKGYPASRVKLEHSIKVGSLNKRCDAVYFDKQLKPHILFEFKAPDIPITDTTLLQSGIYNSKLKAEWLVFSNGLTHYVVRPNYEENKFNMVEELPAYGIDTKSQE